MENKATAEVDWKQEILSWEKSGLSQKKYCQQRQLHYHRFVYEKSQLQPKRQSTGKFLPVKTVAIEEPLDSLGVKNMRSAYLSHWILTSPSGYQLSVPTESGIPVLNRLLDFMGEKRC